MSRTLLTANTQFHCSPSGSDSTGDGSSGSPWRQPQKAINHLRASVDLGGHEVRINLADGTYSPVTLKGRLEGQSSPDHLILVGNPTNPENVVIQATNSTAVVLVFGAMMYVQHLKAEAFGTGGLFLSDFAGAYGRSYNVICGESPGYHFFAAHLGAWECVQHKIAGSSGKSHWGASYKGLMKVRTAVDFLDDVSFGEAFATASGCSAFEAPQCQFNLNGKTVTGTRYKVIGNSSLDTGGGGANYFPGDTAGWSDSGGQYI